MRRLIALADDPGHDEETFVLRDIGGPRPRGDVISE
jgi:hypothetical protein